MKLIALENPDDAADLAGWVESHLVGHRPAIDRGWHWLTANVIDQLRQGDAPG